MTDKPQHCDHECVCNWWACNVNCDILNDPCRRKNCEHDTRSRPLSSELKKERERVLCELLAYIHPDSRAGCVIKDKIESLRGEPIKDITVGNSGGNR